MVPLLRAESRDLQRVDVPIFTARVGGETIFDSRLNAIGGVIAESGLTVVRQIIERLSERDLDRQSWLVRGCLATLDLAETGLESRPRLALDVGRAPAPRDSFLAAADGVAAELANLAYEDSSRASWYAFEYLEHPHWTLRYADPSLYEGVCGIALFLAYHGAVRRDARSTRLARGAVTALLKGLDRAQEQTPQIGVFAGQGGWIYTFVHLARVWRDADLLDRAEGLVPAVLPRIAEDEVCDLVGGSAGLLIALLELARERPSGRIWEAARACGDHLLDAARPQARGVGWPLEVAGGSALLGFSHGTAGIAWALLRLHERTGDRRYRETALEALAYERSLFDEERGNWPDLRAGERPECRAEDASGTHYLTAWCHGAPGILLARALSLPYLGGDSEVRREIERALETTLAEGFETGHCLCHGALGNIDILLVVSRLLDLPKLEEKARQLASAVLGHQSEAGWHYGVPGKMTPPGLMVGLAGFGYQMLRLAEPQRLPSVLALESPPSRDGARRLVDGSAFPQQ
ncbi:MAG: type 2 lanthipeptide synthetase LanM [Acidobacteriota bacterium]